MLRDLAVHPYTSAGDLELAMSWVTSHAQATGIAKLTGVKFRNGIRIQPRPQDDYGQGRAVTNFTRYPSPRSA